MRETPFSRMNISTPVLLVAIGVGGMFGEFIRLLKMVCFLMAVSWLKGFFGGLVGLTGGTLREGLAEDPVVVEVGGAAVVVL